MPWASFPVTFAQQSETVIHVSYIVPLQPSYSGSEMALYYVLQTGAGWAGTIGRVELIVNLPYPASVETIAGKRGSSPLQTTESAAPGDLPPGAVIVKNQARWKWTNFEPGPDNDFAIWVLRPGKWDELEAARTAVQANSQDAQAWIDLAAVYQSLSLHWFRTYLLFSPYYLQPCIDAYETAMELFPEHPVPHVALAIITLLPYMEEKNAPAAVIQHVHNELEVVKELEAKNSSLTSKTGVSSWDLANTLRDYFYNDATATMDAATRAVSDATRTAEATINYATLTVFAGEKSAHLAARETELACWVTAEAPCTATPIPSATFTLESTLTATPLPSNTPQPPPTSSPTITQAPTTLPAAVESKGAGLILFLLVGVGVLLLCCVGYLI